jgi:hypothetical protein
VLVLAACGGGGGLSAPKAAATAPAAAGVNRTAIGTASLTLRFPPGYHTAAARARTNASTARRPAYVNPSAGSLLDIYVSGSLITNLDGRTPNHSVTVAPTSDGTQTIANIPLFSTTSDIAVIEWDPTDTSILAVGENPSLAIAPGTATAVTLTMQMNATGFAIGLAPGSSSATAFSSQPYVVGAPGSPALVYIAPTDALGGYSSATGYGGVPTSITVTSSATAASFGAQPSGAYQVSYASLAGSISITATASNPAAALITPGTQLYARSFTIAALSSIAASDSVSQTLLPNSLVGNIYVANAGNNSVTVYAPVSPVVDQTLNGPPLATISGGNTGLNQPFNIAVDAGGKIYVTNDNGGAGNVTVYAPIPVPLSSPLSSPLSAAPLATLETNDSFGNVNGIPFVPDAVAVDPSGKIYVTNYTNNSVAVYAANPSGAVSTPLTTIEGPDTGLIGPAGITIDPSGNIYVLNGTQSGATQSVTVYPPLSGPLNSTLDLAPSATISGNNTVFLIPLAIGVDPSKNIYVLNSCCFGEVSIYAAVSPSANPINEAPFASVGSYYPHGLAIDASGNIYVEDGDIYVYAANPGNNAVNLAIIGGGQTNLNNPWGVAVH